MCTTLYCVKNLNIFASKVTGCVYIPAFASLAGIPVGIVSSASTKQTCIVIAGIKKYKSIIKKKRKKHAKIVSLQSVS